MNHHERSPVKTIGLIGGMSWESSLEYYRIINEAVKKRLGGLHSADCVMVSLDFADIEALQVSGDWVAAGVLLADAAHRLERAGADCVVICTNTMHQVADAVQQAVTIPLIHIADATAIVVRKAGITQIGLLGTAFTMERDFYKGRLENTYNLDVVTPDAAGRALVHRVIYEELVLGTINPTSRAAYVEVIQSLIERGAQGVILGCTEIGLLIKPADSPLPTFDTTVIHAMAAVDFALSDPILNN